MSEAIYSTSHVALSRLLGRDYNNPLGAAAFPLLARLLAGVSPLRVLDAGCGRGQTALWWAAQGARVTAFDPSLAMLDEARERAKANTVSDAIRFVQAVIADFESEERYDLILAQDVLCYSSRWEEDAARLAALLAPGGLLSVTDYFREGDAPEVASVLSAWGILPPCSFAEKAQTLTTLGLAQLFQFDTTRHYREHWTALAERLAAKQDEAEALIGEEESRRFAARISAILQAVAGTHFGHCWCLLQKETT